MDILIDNEIHLKFKDNSSLNKALDIVSKKLVYKNPAYIKARKKTGSPEYINDYKVTGKTIKLPKGQLKLARELAKTLGLEKISDKRTVGHQIKFSHKFEPRDSEQERALESYLEATKSGGGAIIHAICGFGKSFCALKLIELLKTSTMILVDETLLLEQWIEAIEDDSNFDLEKLGIIGLNKEVYKDKDIIIASKDTLINRPEIMEYLSNNIEFVIVDEAHVSSASIFQNVLKALKPKRILGLTATPKRSDGASYLMYNEIGDICFSASREFLIQQGSVMLPWLKTVFVKRTKKFSQIFEEWKKEELEKMNSLQPNDEGKYKWKLKEYTPAGFKRITTMFKRNSMDWQFLSTKGVEGCYETIEKIAKLIKFHYDNGDQIIGICQKVAFSKKYKKALIALGIPEEHIGVVLGETKKKERKEIIAKAKAGEIKILLTSKILDKGISINSANILFLLYPSKNSSTLEQRVGRVSRTNEGKNYAIVYDFVYDDKIFFSQYYKNYKPCLKEKGCFCMNRGLCNTIPEECSDILDLEYRLRVYRECTKFHPSVEKVTQALEMYFKNNKFERTFFKSNEFDLDNLTPKNVGKSFYIEV